MILYRIPKAGIKNYENLNAFAFESEDFLFFTDRKTAEKLGADVVEINPTGSK